MSGPRFLGEVYVNVPDDYFESQTGLRTAEYFWKCPECRKKGCVFNGRLLTN
jgi:lipopolysaccharide biosynthesis regulator YciM